MRYTRRSLRSEDDDKFIIDILSDSDEDNNAKYRLIPKTEISRIERLTGISRSRTSSRGSDKNKSNNSNNSTSSSNSRNISAENSKANERPKSSEDSRKKRKLAAATANDETNRVAKSMFYFFYLCRLRDFTDKIFVSSYTKTVHLEFVMTMI